MVGSPQPRGGPALSTGCMYMVLGSLVFEKVLGPWAFHGSTFPSNRPDAIRSSTRLTGPPSDNLTLIRNASGVKVQLSWFPE